MLRRVVSNPLFYIVLLGGCVALFFSVRTAKGSGWLGVWTADKQAVHTVYQQKTFIDDSVVGVTMLHLELTQRNTATTISFQQAVDVLQQSDHILSNNIISYLQNASNKTLALQTYTKNIDRTLAQADSALSTLQLDYDTASAENAQCASDKIAADNQFFQGLGSADAGMMQVGYNDALKAGACQTISRISTNVYQAVIGRMRTYTVALQQLDTLLVSNEDMIISNVDLFKENYLERLIQIRDQLGSAPTSSAID